MTRTCPEPGCREGFEKVVGQQNTYCFSMLGGLYSHVDARQWCRSLGAELFFPQTNGECREMSKYVQKAYEERLNIWVGYVRSNGTNKNVFVVPGSNEPMPDIWNGGQPNNKGGDDCAVISKDTNKWDGVDDVYCTLLAKVVCQYSCIGY